MKNKGVYVVFTIVLLIAAVVLFYKYKNNSKNLDEFKALKVCLHAGFSDEDKLSFIDSEGNDVIEKYIDEIRMLYEEKIIKLLMICLKMKI